MPADLTLERRRRLTHRALPAAAVLAVLAFVFGLTVGGGQDSDTERVARAFSAAWQKEDYAAMHRLLSAETRAAVSRDRFATAYGDAAATATTRRLAIADPETDGDVARLPVTAHTAAFGPVEGEVELPVADGAVDWRPHLVFPDLAPGVALSRRTTAPERAKLLTAGGEVLAEGPAEARSSPLAVASSIAGALETPTDPAEQEQLYARGFPEGTPVGVSGLERVFEDQLAGKPGA